LTYPVLTSIPFIHALPEVFGYIPVSTEIKVVLPAPFGPNNPNIYLSSIIKVRGFKAT
jgi:hypothetical protein